MKSVDYLIGLYGQFQNCPSIIAGDFNLAPGTYVISSLESKFSRANKQITNSLNPSNHGIFRDNPKGSNVDHIFFSQEFEIKTCKCQQVDISDHLPVLTEFDLN
jgi:endonuclease/exonuclease/phosphatase family metal-dependent hydrolase